MEYCFVNILKWKRMINYNPSYEYSYRILQYTDINGTVTENGSNYNVSNYFNYINLYYIAHISQKSIKLLKIHKITKYIKLSWCQM